MRLWKVNKVKQATSRVGFTQFSGGITIRDATVQVRSPGVQTTPLFQQEELADSLPETSGRLDNMANLGQFLERDMSINEAQLRMSLGDQFNLAVESVMEDMMEHKE